MALTDTNIRTKKPQAKPVKLSDGGGLYLLITPQGAKLWRLAYRFAGRQKTLALGAYPAVTLAMARAQREAAKRLLAQGIDPSEQRRADKRAAAAATDFGEVADEWFATKMEREGKSERTLERARWLTRVLKRDLGRRPIGEIEPPELLTALRRVEAQGHFETVARLRSLASQIFRYGIASGYCSRDPASDLRGALTSPTEKHRPAITDPSRLGEMLRAIDAYESVTTRLALILLSLTAVRPGELRCAEWSEIDADAKVWAIPGEKMKMREAHRVPLSRQAVDVLSQLRPLTGQGLFLFPASGQPPRPISENTLNAALRRMGFGGDEMVSHGFRATFSTLLNEEGTWSPDVIEHALAHRERNTVRRAYNRATHWPERVSLMQHWADRLDELRQRGKVVSISRSAG